MQSNPITMPLVCHHYRTEVGVAINLNCYFCFNIIHFPCNYITFTKVQYSIFIHSVYTTHQISNSKTFHAWRKIKIQMVGHNITAFNFILYLIISNCILTAFNWNYNFDCKKFKHNNNLTTCENLIDKLKHTLHIS